MKLKGAYRLFTITILMSSLSFAFGADAMAATKLYDQVTEKTVTKGVTYEMNHRLNQEGWQDIYTLKIDLNADNVAIAPVESTTEYGLKETVVKMLGDNKAIAGVNADFFGLSGKYSAGFGPVVKNGEIISVGTDKNLTKNEYAAFFMNENGESFIDYLKFTADFVNSTGGKLELASINKVTQMVYPIYFDSNAAPNTKSLDARFPNLVKIVVQNGAITYISKPGEVVDTPKDDGYLIIVSGIYTTYTAQNFAVGQTVETKIKSSVDLSQIETAIGGAGKILENGQIATGGTIIKGRQPRTALGISADKKKLIIMVVDGRGDSIGATHEEMAALMKEYGAYNAMHLDGGGSSTMAVNPAEDDKLSVVNKVSEGTERKVIDAIGIFDTAETGSIKELVIKPSSERAFVGNNISFNVFGYDEYYHKINVPIADIQFSSTDTGGSFNGNVFVPSVEGIMAVSAAYEGHTTSVIVESMSASSIAPSTNVISLPVGQSAEFEISGVSTEGYTAPISQNVIYTLSDSSIGTLNGNKFTATANGSGYIKCTLGNANCYIKVAVGGTEKAVTSFESGVGVKLSVYPNEVKGSAGVTEYTANGGKKSLELKYTFANLNQTQAAYLNFNTPIKLDGQPTSIKLSVFGNGSGQWLRGKIKDAKGNSQVIDFTKNVNWTDWKDVSAAIPSGVAYPISLESIYIASLANTDTTEKALYFDNLRGTFPNVISEVPSDTVVPDRKKITIEDMKQEDYYITMAGTVSLDKKDKPANYTSERVNIHNQLQKNSDLMIYGGGNDISLGSSVETIKYSNNYKFYSKPNVSIVQMTASKGGLRKTAPSQWTSFKNDILSSSNTNVIIVMDKTPSNFSDAQEAKLFRSVLSDITLRGKNIFVVSSSGTGSWNTVKEGVRYINLPDMWNSDGSLNKAFTMAVFKINQYDMSYDIKSIY